MKSLQLEFDHKQICPSSNAWCVVAVFRQHPWPDDWCGNQSLFKMGPTGPKGGICLDAYQAI